MFAVRAPFLQAHPISRLLVFHRHSYTDNGKSDSVTTAWMIWLRQPADAQGRPPILSLVTPRPPETRPTPRRRAEIARRLPFNDVSHP